ncbi:MAG TPA: hypothetical protein PK472_14745, partial [Pseudomonadota bacterium]|nr:hypothetical protein [Pseudomonadota bacterium]
MPPIPRRHMLTLPSVFCGLSSLLLLAAAGTSCNQAPPAQRASTAAPENPSPGAPAEEASGLPASPALRAAYIAAMQADAGAE